MNFKPSILHPVLALTLLAWLPVLGGQTTATVTTLHDFSALDGNNFNSDGSSPYAALVQGSDGNFYGTASGGGTGGEGTVFKLTPAGVLTTLHSFSARVGDDTNTDGAYPLAAVIQGQDGAFYGTADLGGDDGVGTVFKITSAGTFTTVHGFNGDEGANPHGALLQDTDGDFYGTVFAGGASASGFGDLGTIFKVTSAGVLTTLYSFDLYDGAQPAAGLIKGSDGAFYGTTQTGGSTASVGSGGSMGSLGDGTVFRYSAQDGHTTLHNFGTTTTDGTYPDATLVQDGDGNFYGTAAEGSPNTEQAGSVFKISAAGTLTILHSFTGNDDGATPYAGLVQGKDGNFYGVTTYSNIGSFDGTIFQVTPTGALTTLHTFAGPDGANARAALIEDSEGAFYGTTSTGGKNGQGTIFKMTLAKTVITITSATSANATEGVAFSYQITATGDPTSYGVQGLPAGLTVNASKGLISGTPQSPGKVALTLNAYNGAGKGSATLTLTIAAAPPIITSAKTASGDAGASFSYQIAAGNHPTSFGVQGLPSGLTVNATTGLISGTTKAAGTDTLTLNAYNSAGKGSETLTLTVTLTTPVITSATSASATVGKAFSYQIAATGNPTSYGVQGLPAGITVDASTGLVSGTPKAAGKISLTLNAYNSKGKGSATLTLTITN